MRKILTLVLGLAMVAIIFTACAKLNTAIPVAIDALTPAPVVEPTVLTTVSIENRSTQVYYGYVKATIPFKKGEFKGTEVYVTQDGETVDFLPIKWYLENGNKSTVALAVAHFKAKLPPSGFRSIEILRSQGKVAPFSFGPNLALMIGQGKLQDSFMMAYKAPGQAECYATIEGNLELLQDMQSRKVFRLRTHPRCNGVSQPISFTTIWELPSGQDHGTLNFIVGNDTLEMPVSGGIQIESVDILIKNNFGLGIVSPGSYSIPATTTRANGYRQYRIMQNTSIGDGQTFAIKARWNVVGDPNSIDRQSFLAAINGNPMGELIGFVPFKEAQATQAYGPTGVLPDPRWTDLQAARNALAHHCTDPMGSSPQEYLGRIDKIPGSTGDQDDFFSGSAIFAQQALQTQSICPVRSATIAVYKESWRPSYYSWTPPGGHERPVEGADFPEFMFWSGRVMYDPSWNNMKPGYNLWAPRVGFAFNRGNSFGWEAYDNQHYSMHSLISLYELTGDPYLGSVLSYNQTITYFDYYTGLNGVPGYFNGLDADRAVGRLQKNVSQFFNYFPDKAAALKARLPLKNQNVLLPTLQNNAQWAHFAFINHVIDPRITLTTRCTNGEFVSQNVNINQCWAVMGWQVGFVAEFIAQALRNGQGTATMTTIGQMFMDSADKYFDAATGQPVTYFLSVNPSIRDFGGIGEQWWVGWITLAKYFPNHPKKPIIDMFEARMAPYFETRNAVDVYWRGEDDFKS